VHNPIIHPIFTPEYYTPHNDNPFVRSLCVFSDSLKVPQVLNCPASVAVNILFNDSPHKIISFDDTFLLYINIQDQLNYRNPNCIITSYLRNYSICNYGTTFPEAVMGDVLIFGANNLSNKKLSLRNYSVPYQMVEEIMTIYEKYTTP